MSEKRSRRQFIGASAAIALTAIAGCLGEDDEQADPAEGNDEGDANGFEQEEDVPEAIDEYLAETPNYEGTIADATGEDEVRVALTGDNLFEPAAIRIDAGTTIVWEWEAGAHNVVADEDSDEQFDSGDVVSDETYEYTFEDAGIQLYECEPHIADGMFGGIEVV